MGFNIQRHVGSCHLNRSLSRQRARKWNGWNCSNLAELLTTRRRNEGQEILGPERWIKPWCVWTNQSLANLASWLAMHVYRWTDRARSQHLQAHVVLMSLIWWEVKQLLGNHGQNLEQLKQMSDELQKDEKSLALSFVSMVHPQLQNATTLICNSSKVSSAKRDLTDGAILVSVLKFYLARNSEA